MLQDCTNVIPGGADGGGAGLGKIHLGSSYCASTEYSLLQVESFPSYPVQLKTCVVLLISSNKMTGLLNNFQILKSKFIA